MVMMIMMVIRITPTYFNEVQVDPLGISKNKKSYATTHTISVNY